MGRRQLTAEQLEVANTVLNEVRSRLDTMCNGDPRLLFYLRRRIFLHLTYDERGTPAHRKKLKLLKMNEQGGRCSLCQETLPEKEAELDRFIAWKGYTSENTQLIHHDCHRRQQQERRFGSSDEG